jgi:hypothetical protein
MKSVQIKVDCYQLFPEYPVIIAHSPLRRRERLNISVYPLRSLCSLCASAVNELLHIELSMQTGDPITL